MPPKADINKAGWEQSEFPILCETCKLFHLSLSCINITPICRLGLGDNPFIRMVWTFSSRNLFVVADLLLLSQSRSTAAHVVHVHDHSPFSDGILVQERVSKRPSFAKPVLKSRTCARRVFWISNMAYLLK